MGRATTGVFRTQAPIPALKAGSGIPCRGMRNTSRSGFKSRLSSTWSKPTTRPTEIRAKPSGIDPLLFPTPFPRICIIRQPAEDESRDGDFIFDRFSKLLYCPHIQSDERRTTHVCPQRRTCVHSQFHTFRRANNEIETLHHDIGRCGPDRILLLWLLGWPTEESHTFLQKPRHKPTMPTAMAGR